MKNNKKFKNMCFALCFAFKSCEREYYFPINFVEYKMPGKFDNFMRVLKIKSLIFELTSAKQFFVVESPSGAKFLYCSAFGGIQLKVSFSILIFALGASFLPKMARG